MNIKQAKKQLNKPLDLKSLTPAQARVEIAKDVIAALKLTRLQAESGLYINSGTIELDSAQNKNAKMLGLLKAAPTCQVCALGAVFVAAISRGAVEDRSYYFEPEELRYSLTQYFDRDTLLEIERYFEGSGVGEGDRYAEVFYDQVAPDDDYRLELIMNNIIENNGDFCPPDEWSST